MATSPEKETFQQAIWRLILEAGETSATITIGEHEFEVELPPNLVEAPQG